MRISTSILFSFLALSGALSGCKSRPELAQVSSSAEAKPINSPETAQQLRSKYEK